VLYPNTPRAAQPNILLLRLGGQFTTIKDKKAILVRVMLALRSDEASRMLCAVDFAILEECDAIAKDEIHDALDVALRKVLSRGGAGLAIGSGTGLVCCIQRVLIPQEAHVSEHRSVARHQQRL
jgi:hypothetical protein